MTKKLYQTKKMATRRREEWEMRISNRIREYRLAKGMTQTKLANLVGMSYQQLQKYELGQNRITVGKIAMIAESMNIPIQYFFQPGFVEPAQARTLSMDQEQWISLIKDLNNETARMHLMGLILQICDKKRD